MKEVISNLIIPGAPKSGTTSLHNYLNQHPEISMMPIKEPQYFSIDEIFNKGNEYYNSLFSAQKKNAKYFGESSTTYFVSDIAIERIKKMLNQPKFIFVLRDPVERIISNYKYMFSLHLEERPFRKSVEEDLKKMLDLNRDMIKGECAFYFLFSSYGTFVKKYFDAFGKENCFIITTEEMKNDSLKTVNNCFRFLELSSLAEISETVKNKTQPKKKIELPSGMSKLKFLLPSEKLRMKIKILFFQKQYKFPEINQEDKKWIKELLLPEFELLKKITERDFPEWKTMN